MSLLPAAWPIPRPARRRITPILRRALPFVAEFGVERRLSGLDPQVDLGLRVERAQAAALARAPLLAGPRDRLLRRFVRAWSTAPALARVSRLFLELDLPPRAPAPGWALFATVEDVFSPRARAALIRAVGERFELSAEQRAALLAGARAPGLHLLHLGLLPSRPGSPVRLALWGPTAIASQLALGLDSDAVRLFSWLAGPTLSVQLSYDQAGACLGRVDLELSRPQGLGGALLALEAAGLVTAHARAELEAIEPAELSHLKLIVRQGRSPELKAYVAAPAGPPSSGRGRARRAR